MTDFHPRRSAAFLVIALVLAALFIGVYLTRGGDPSLEYNAPPPLSNTAGLVDQKPLETARNLADQAATSGEVEFARQAVQLADHEVDQAFAQALRQATEHAPPLTGAALAISHRITAITGRIQQEQQQVKAATAAGQDTQLAEAQLALDQDELEDMQQDLVRLGGDRKAKIQQALDQHEAVQKLNDARPRNNNAAQMESPAALSTMPGKVRVYAALGSRAKQLQQARADAVNAARLLAAQHDALESRTETQDATRAAAPAPAPASPVHDNTAAASASALGAAGVLDTLHTLASQRTTLAQLDKQIHDEQQLTDIYTRWRALVLAQRTTVLQRIFRILIVVVVLLAAVLTANAFILRFFSRRASGSRKRTLETVLTVAIQLVGLGLVLMVLFGVPRQTPTIIGLATAGLTVVLKDFIVAFFGWFVLMGKNGVRVGDWVEINSVSGEVVELGIMRTTLLETGNWNESAQPTGRRVTFMNSYAIEGQFFNFSTTGQWLWDELRVNVTAGPAAYDKVDAIRRVVEERTRQYVALAEKDWERANRSQATHSLNATPAVDLRPTPDGIQVSVRYITRAQERAQVRSELNEKAVGILHYPDRVFAPAGDAPHKEKAEPSPEPGPLKPAS